ncbi:MAG: gliding motility-associated-like protein, partial [Nonlabens sp.]
DCPDPGNCDDGICENGEEVWDGDLCECIAINVPTPCTDDGDCTNGFEVWDANTCTCNITPSVFGCTDPAANNFDPAATCDDGSCEFDCPDPGNCDDGICANGEEVWDGDLCECITINVPTPCEDDGDCSNGDEVWDADNCICNQENVPTPCEDDGDCTNGEEIWDTATCTCTQINVPTPCEDDGDCTNGFEIWDATTCSCNITPPVLGCTNPIANNFDPTATCDDGSCTFDCPDPGNCDDGNCENGEEVWDGDICECIVINVPTPCEDDGDCTNGFEVWDANTCTCNITPSVFGCTDPAANNFDPAATCDDGSCEFDCPDPGNCDDGDCSNGLETWDDVLCECQSGTSVDCTNGTTSQLPCDDDDPCTDNDMQIVLDCDGTVCVPCTGSIPTDCNNGATTSLPCDDGDDCTTNDMELILNCDGSVCEPCMGIAIDCSTGSTSVVPCDDGNPSTINDMETILDCDGSTCEPCIGEMTDCATGETSIVVCDDGDPCTINDEETILDADGTVCVPCAGQAIVEDDIAALDDAFEIDVTEMLSGDLSDNDELISNLNFVYENTTSPEFGALNLSEDGTFTYQVITPVSENDAFSYQVCLENCPAICSEADVELSIFLSEIIIPDAISPNGDGVNDFWVIPGILNWENNKMIVVNRWGDPVYEASPYINEWGGESKKGGALSEGTYYYYLSLDIADGKTYKGTITIVR